MQVISPSFKKIMHSKSFLRLVGCMDVFKDAGRNFFKNGDMNQAAAIALYAFLSIIPLFILSVLAAGRVLGSKPQVQEQLIGVLEGFHPGLSGGLLNQLGQMDEKRKLLGWIGVITLIWFSSMIFGAVETALNIAFRSRVHRNFLLSKLLAISMILLGWGIALASITLTYFATILGQTSLVENWHFWHGGIVRYCIPYLVAVTFFTAVYRIIPSKKIPLRTLLIGSAYFALLMEAVKHVFTWYVARHTRYHLIFGSLETVVILVIWVFYVSLLFLFCAELMSSYERRNLILIEKALLQPGKQTTRDRLLQKFGRLYPAGAVVFREGDQDREMYYILTGSVRLEKKSGRVRKTLAELGPGQQFGEMATLINAPRTATAVSLTDSDLAVIDGEMIQHLLRENDDVAIHMLKEFAKRIRDTNTALDDLTQSWLHLVILLELLRQRPWPSNLDLAKALADQTGKPVTDITEVLDHLSEEGVLAITGTEPISFNETRAWQFFSTLLHRPALNGEKNVQSPF